MVTPNMNTHACFDVCSSHAHQGPGDFVGLEGRVMTHCNVDDIVHGVAKMFQTSDLCSFSVSH